MIIYNHVLDCIQLVTNDLLECVTKFSKFHTAFGVSLFTQHTHTPIFDNSPFPRESFDISGYTEERRIALSKGSIEVFIILYRSIPLMPWVFSEEVDTCCSCKVYPSVTEYMCTSDRLMKSPYVDTVLMSFIYSTTQTILFWKERKKKKVIINNMFLLFHFVHSLHRWLSQIVADVEQYWDRMPLIRSDHR